MLLIVVNDVVNRSSIIFREKNTKKLNPLIVHVKRLLKISRNEYYNMIAK